MRAALLSASLLTLAACAAAPTPGVSAGDVADPKLVLVTFDGVRWQEVFRGADAALSANAEYTNLGEWLMTAYLLEPDDSAAAIMPFVHGVMAEQGVLMGDRDAGECAEVANDMWFSYPGYNELLTGRPDPEIVSNGDVPNANVTFLEYLNRDPAFAGRVAAIGTWTVYPSIINAERSGIPVNAAFGDQWPTDILTARYAFDMIANEKPRVLYVGLGDTDEQAHAGDYDQYLSDMERGDDFVRELWTRLQADPYYAGQTTLIVTTDHGRGNEQQPGSWRDHAAVRYYEINPQLRPEYNGTGVIGSNEVWFAAMGPGVTDRAAVSAYTGGTCAQSRQVAASALTALGVDWRTFDEGAGEPFAFMAE